MSPFIARRSPRSTRSFRAAASKRIRPSRPRRRPLGGCFPLRPTRSRSRTQPGARKIAAALALVAAPAIALGLYAKIGHPALPDQPLEARMSAPPAQQDFAAVVAKMEAHLAAHPEDGRALELMAPVYLRLGRYDEAVKARAQALKILGETPDRLVKIRRGAVLRQ